MPIVLITSLGLGLVAFAVAAWMQHTGGTEEAAWMPTVEKSSFQRFCGRIGTALYQITGNTLAKKKRRDSQTLILAGMSPQYNAEEVLGMQTAVAVSLALLGALLVSSHLVPAVLVGGILGWILPPAQFRDKKDKRQTELTRDFPAAMDMMIVAVGSGMAIGQSLVEVARYAPPGPVAEEFARINYNVGLNQPLPVVLREAADRFESNEVKTVMVGLSQAMRLGSDILDTLRTQGEQLRYHRLMRAEEAAQKAPVKMSGPMLFLITPCVVLIIVGPLLVSVLKTFSEFDL